MGGTYKKLVQKHFMRGGSRIRSVERREETTLRLGGDGDNFHMSWAEGDTQYVSVCDGMGLVNRRGVSYNSRLFEIAGGPVDAQFRDVEGYPFLGRPTQPPGAPRYYGLGTLALGSHIYQFTSTLSAQLDPEAPLDSGGKCLARFNGVKLIYSHDHGRTWRNQDGSRPVTWESWDDRSRGKLIFFEEVDDCFALLSILQMGRNYEHNRDGYVYVYAPNGSIEGKMNELVMFRVPKSRITERSTYEYFAGISGAGAATWSTEIEDRRPVHVFPRGWVNTRLHPYAWQPSVCYNAPLGIYLMANWGMGCGSDGMWFAKPSYLGFWAANTPWGPWEQVHEEVEWMPAGDRNARAYQPQIAPKWISEDGMSLWIAWTDYQGADDFMRIWVSGQKTADGSPAGVAKLVAMRRECMPYYSLNVQRVDFLVE